MAFIRMDTIDCGEGHSGMKRDVCVHLVGMSLHDAKTHDDLFNCTAEDDEPVSH